MNSFVLIALVAFAASAQAGFLSAPVAAPIVYHAPTVYASPIYTAQYPTYAVHSPHVAPVVKTLASPVYAAPVYHAAPVVYHSAPVVKYHSHGYGGHYHK